MDSDKSPGATTEADKSDDLISELARLMASEAAGNHPGSTTAAPERKEPDLGSATQHQPAAPSVTAEPSVRVPGTAPQSISTPSQPSAAPRQEPAQLSESWFDAPKTPVAPNTATPQAAPHRPVWEREPEPPVSLPPSFTAPRSAALQSGAPVLSPAGGQPGTGDDPIGALIAEQLDLRAPGHGGAPHTPQVEPSAWNAPLGPREPLTSPPQPAAGTGPRDPLDEIENLIGESVRVQSSPAPAEPQRISPYQSQIAQPHSLQPQQPAPDAMQPSDPELAAEAAILAAADSEPPFPPMEDPGTPSGFSGYAGDDEGLMLRERPQTVEFEPVPAPRRRLVRILGPVLALLILAAIGAGAWWGLGLNGEEGFVPLLLGDTGEVKDVPEETVDPGGEAASGSVVFDEMDGTDTAATDGEQLVSRDETDGAVGTDVSRVINTTDSGVAETGEDAEGLLNRRVRTVTVRPDGTIVSGEEALAGSEVLPVDRPDVPELPGDEATSGQTLDDIGSLIVDEGAAAGEEAVAAGEETVAAGEEVLTDTVDAAVDSATAAAVDAVTPDAVEIPAADTPANTEVASTETATETAEVAPAANINPNLVAPVPLPPPANRAALAASASTSTSTSTSAATSVATTPLQLGNNALVGTVANPAPNPNANPGAVDLVGESTVSDTTTSATTATPATTDTGATVAAATETPAYVQMSSQRTEQAAQQTLVAMQSRYGTIFGGNSLEIQQVDLGDSGVFYRVRLPTSGIDEATQVCTSVRAAGGDCFVRTD